MPSPFPGMDPFLEFQEWEDFHYSFNAAIRDALSSRLAPRYLVRAERRVYVEFPGDRIRCFFVRTSACCGRGKRPVGLRGGRAGHFAGTVRV